MKRYIHDFISLKNFLTEARTPVLSVGVTAFSRVGATPSPNYQIFCLESTSDIDIIRSDYLVECLADIDPIYYQSHKKKTESIVEHPFLTNKAVDQKNGLILVYKYTDEIHRITKGLGLTVAGRIPSSGELLENKIFFRQLIKDIDIDSYKTYSLTCNDLDYS